MAHTPLTAQQLDEYEALTDAATPGPWHLTDADTIVAPLTVDTIADVWEPTQASRNGEFIEVARTAVPALVADNRRLRQQNRFLLAALAAQGVRSGDTEKALRAFLSAEPDDETPAARPVAAADTPTT